MLASDGTPSTAFRVRFCRRAGTNADARKGAGRDGNGTGDTK